MDYDHDFAMALHPDASKDMPNSSFLDVMTTLEQATKQRKAQHESVESQSEPENQDSVQESSPSERLD